MEQLATTISATTLVVGQLLSGNLSGTSAGKNNASILLKICLGSLLQCHVSTFPSMYFKNCGTSTLESNSETLSDSFVVFPLSIFSKHASELAYSKILP